MSKDEERVEKGPGEAEPGGKGEAEPGPARPHPAWKAGRRYTADEKLAVMKACDASGLGTVRFCAEQKVTSASLCAWRRAFKRGGVKALAPKANPRNGKKQVHRGPYKPAERLQTVQAYAKSGLSLRDFSKVWGIRNHKTLSTWIRLYRDEGPKRLEGLKSGRKPGKSMLPASVRGEIVSVKRGFPAFGLRRVQDFLLRFRGTKVSTGSIRKTLKAEGLPPVPKVLKKRRSIDKIRYFERAKPGQMWQTDITSFVLTRHSQRVYLVVFMDDYSRYIVSWRLAMRATSSYVIETLLEGVQRFGKPEEVLTDQGPQYHSWRGKSEFDKILKREGIEHVLARSHHPQTVGKCERFWATVANEFWERAKPQELNDARERLGHFIAHYNHFRPHQGMGIPHGKVRGLVPADRLFGSESAVRKALETNLQEHQLQLALGEAPRKTVYLVGQVGDQQVSLHGEHGRLVMRTEGGVVQEIGMEQLGLKKEVTDGEDNDEGTCGVVAGGSGDGPHAPQGRQEAGLQDAAAGGGGEGAVGVGDGGAAAAGAPVRGGGDGVLAGAGDEAGGGEPAGGAALEDLAIIPAGPLGYGGGAVEAAEIEERGSGRGPERGPEDPEEANRGSGADHRDAGPADCGPEGDARMPGGPDARAAAPAGGEAWPQSEEGNTAGSSR